MKHKRKIAAFLSMGIASLCLVACQSTSTSSSTTSTESAIQNIYTISDTYGDGQKITAVAVEFPNAVDETSIDVESFEVKNRKIVSVHTSHTASATSQSTEGKYVLLTLEIQSAILDDKYASDGRIQKNQVMDTATVVQKKDIRSLSGKTYKASSKEVSTPEVSGIMGNKFKLFPTRDKFEDNHFYFSSEWKIQMHYNLFIPEEAKKHPDKTYPLVLFMPDAGSVSKDWETVLAQGNGGTVWVSEDWQKDHPCFVVTMIYDDKFINDYWEYYDQYIGGTIDLVKHLSQTLPIDTNRLYTTGQSMGCMASLIMMSKEPDLFTAAFLVAGKWDPTALVNLKGNKMFLINSEDDSLETNTLMDQAAQLWRQEGASLQSATINGVETLNGEDNTLFDLTHSDASILYCKIQTGTGSIGKDGELLKGSHRMTWRLAYDLPHIKEWLFEQHK